MSYRYLSVLAVIVSIGFECLAATQPQTLTMCDTNPVPPGWIIVKLIYTDNCRSDIRGHYGTNTNTLVLQPIPDIVGMAGMVTPWVYQIVPGAGTPTFIRFNSQKHQICKVSLTATTASFACADVIPVNLSLADLLKK